MDTDVAIDQAVAQLAPLRSFFAIYVPKALPEPGHVLTRLAVLPVLALNEDVYFPLDRLKPAIEQWIEQGYRRQRLFALAAFTAEAAGDEVFSQWDDVLAQWGPWTNEPYGFRLAPRQWTAEEILRREG